MDWFSWLSESSLDSTLVYDYGLLLSHNELDADDIPYFDHQFLLSMGITVAKHRLEILHLAKKHNKSRQPGPRARLLVALREAKRCLGNWIRTIGNRRVDVASIVVVPSSVANGGGGGGGGGRWRGAAVKRSRKMTASSKRLLITDGGAAAARSPVAGGDGDGEKMRWDNMFKDLKPT